MIYEYRLTIPANTLQASPQSAALGVHPGVLNRVQITFPRGCAGLAHLRIYYWEHQLFPSNIDSDFSGDDVHLDFGEDMELTDGPYEFNLVGWNLDDTYQHTITVRLQVTPFDRSIVQVLKQLTAGPAGPITYVTG